MLELVSWFMALVRFPEGYLKPVTRLRGQISRAEESTGTSCPGELLIYAYLGIPRNPGVMKKIEEKAGAEDERAGHHEDENGGPYGV